MGCRGSISVADRARALRGRAGLRVATLLLLESGAGIATADTRRRHRTRVLATPASTGLATTPRCLPRGYYAVHGRRRAGTPTMGAVGRDVIATRGAPRIRSPRICCNTSPLGSSSSRSHRENARERPTETGQGKRARRGVLRNHLAKEARLPSPHSPQTQKLNLLNSEFDRLSAKAFQCVLPHFRGSKLDLFKLLGLVETLCREGCPETHKSYSLSSSFSSAVCRGSLVSSSSSSPSSSDEDGAGSNPRTCKRRAAFAQRIRPASTAGQNVYSDNLNNSQKSAHKLVS